MLIYLTAASLIALPMPVTPVGVLRRALVVFACIGFLYLLFTVLCSIWWTTPGQIPARSP
ncbi:hypothetical protein [uncultured Desulfovibrio sp.]|uniref:hypothetical protein n=1 Tax=uncultured Desulfovibrio sp. TaxID=167968 RepID=UPI002611113E|nr:hypothetical protein [uncultured Desulfovibrio sp.]